MIPAVSLVPDRHWTRPACWTHPPCEAGLTPWRGRVHLFTLQLSKAQLFKVQLSTFKLSSLLRKSVRCCWWTYLWKLLRRRFTHLKINENLKMGGKIYEYLKLLTLEKNNLRQFHYLLTDDKIPTSLSTSVDWFKNISTNRVLYKPQYLLTDFEILVQTLISIDWFKNTKCQPPYCRYLFTDVKIPTSLSSIYRLIQKYHYFSPLNTFTRKREGSGSVLMINGSGCGSYGSRSGTLASGT